MLRPLLLATVPALLALGWVSPAAGQALCTTPEPIGEIAYDTYRYGPVPDGPGSEPDRTVGVQMAGNVQYADPFLPEMSGRLLAVTLCLRTKPLQFPGTSLVVRLREDDAGIPGNVLEDWVVANNFTGLRNVELVSESRPELSDGAVYWINVASNTDTSFGTWAVAATPTIWDWLAALTRDEDPPGGWLVPTGPPLLHRGLAFVEVPEPGAAPRGAAAAVAVTLVAAWRRRHRADRRA